MPNHVVNYVLCPKLNEDEAKPILELLYDFSRLIPQPQWVLDIDHKYQAQHGEWIMSEELHDWQRENWGTKWSSYRFKFIEGGVRFETAWRHPFPVIQELFMRYPQVDFVVSYASEDIGNHLGSYGRENGLEKIYFSDNDDPERAEEFALHLWQRDSQEYEDWV